VIIMTRKYYGLYAVITVLLIALLIPGAIASVSEQSGYITVGLAPVADFDALYAYNFVPTTVAFRDLSTGTTPMNYLWEFGDGATSTEQNPSHTYIRRGLYTVKLAVTNAYGSSTKTKENYIAIGLAPSAEFSADPTTGNMPLAVAFTDRSTGHPTTWNWNFGDGRASTEQNPVHMYYTSGEFTVILTASNEYGTSDTSKAYFIHVIPPLKSKFVADPKSGKVPLLVKFTDMSTGNPESRDWDFGDGSTSTQANPVHAYTAPGAYHVSLTVSRGINTDTSTQTLVAGGVPASDFVADSTTVSVNTPVHFTDKTLNSPTSWSWNFGDGVTSTEQNPTHAYPVKGIYTVTLTATNNDGRDTEVKSNYITVGLSPIADFFTQIPPYQQGTRMQYARFIDTSAGNPTSWSWDFGDGQTSGEQYPPLHLYNVDGTYSVSLTVKNIFGQDTMVKTNLITVKQGPQVDFKADKTRVSVDQFIRFMDLSTHNPTDWTWDFGDGTVGTGQNPEHIYHQPGSYDVTLTASDAYIAISHTKKDYITVVNLPNADFVADKTKGIMPFTVKFTDISTGKPTQWTWDFGDGATSTEQNPTHTFTTKGTSSTNTFTVILTVANANGDDTAKKVDYITVTQTPIAEFTVDSRQGKAPFIVKFRDLSAGNPTSWSWEFGDGTGSSEQNPTHLYPFEGAYDVRLTVSNQFGSDTVFKTGTSSQRGNAAPVPLTTLAPPAPTTAPKTEIPPVVKTTVPTPIPTTTKSPLSPFVTVVASVIGLLVIVAAKRK
jgi:PKD repeat protein